MTVLSGEQSFLDYSQLSDPGLSSSRHQLLDSQLFDPRSFQLPTIRPKVFPAQRTPGLGWNELVREKDPSGVVLTNALVYERVVPGSSEVVRCAVATADQVGRLDHERRGIEQPQRRGPRPRTRAEPEPETAIAPVAAEDVEITPEAEIDAVA